MTSNENLARNALSIREAQQYQRFVESILALTRRAEPERKPLVRTGFTDPPVDWDLLLRSGGKWLGEP